MSRLIVTVKIIFVVAIVLHAGLFILVVANAPTWGVKEGSLAPTFTATDIHGRTVSLNDFNGTPVLLDFWFSHCGPCHRDLPALKEIWDRHKGDLVIIGISDDDRMADLRKYVVENDIEWIQIADTIENRRQVTKLYDVSMWPTYYLLDETGNVSLSGFGVLEKIRAKGPAATRGWFSRQVYEVFGVTNI